MFCGVPIGYCPPSCSHAVCCLPHSYLWWHISFYQAIHFATAAMVSRGAFTAHGHDVKVVMLVYGHLPGYIEYKVNVEWHSSYS